MIPNAPTVTNRLVLAKQLLQSATIQAKNSYNSMNRILAVISCDLSIETTLKTVIQELTSKKKPEFTFPDLIKQVDSLLKENNLGEFPNRARVEKIHDFRNDAQHKAKSPSETDVRDCIEYTNTFLEQLLVKFGIFQ
ncbi:MAG: DUF4145 domain-containing protein [Anaerolineae bacterium]|nr:DUF4145 domain-containing protein [Anaerolineae bacterium]